MSNFIPSQIKSNKKTSGHSNTAVALSKSYQHHHHHNYVSELLFLYLKWYNVLLKDNRHSLLIHLLVKNLWALIITMLTQLRLQHHQQAINHTTITPKAMQIQDSNQILNPHIIIMEAIHILVRNRIYLQLMVEALQINNPVRLIQEYLLHL